MPRKNTIQAIQQTARDEIESLDREWEALSNQLRAIRKKRSVLRKALVALGGTDSTDQQKTAVTVEMVLKAAAASFQDEEAIEDEELKRRVKAKLAKVPGLSRHGVGLRITQAFARLGRTEAGLLKRPITTNDNNNHK